MSWLTILLMLLLSAIAENLSDVNYSFDVNFYRNFNSKKCNGISAWRLVRYETLNIESLYDESDNGIRALEQSCASSFPISFFGGVLEVNVYIRARSQKFAISVEVFDEDDVSISHYAYGAASEGFGQGWHTISLRINKRTKGYVQLRGISNRNEIVVIDSFRYKPNNTNTGDLRKIKRSINYDDENQTENIYNNEVTVVEEEEDRLKSTIEDEDNTEDIFEDSMVSGFEDILDHRSESARESDKEAQKSNNSLWSPLLISLVTVAFVIVALITGVSAYYCGKVKGTDAAVPPNFIDDIEPPRTIIIPRATGTFENISRFRRFD